MPRYTVQAEATMNARPDVIWDILTDYESLHPMILPRGFSPIQVEQGGKGAGTIINFSVRALGITTQYHGLVSTPEPGRVLVETYQTSTTTFTITPMEGAQGARVQISTELDSRPGLPGALERAMTSMVMHRLYREELGKLATLAESRSVASQPAR